MAIPLKTGADLYNNELLRARLHNHPADALDEYGVGSFYFNNSSGLNSSNRMRYRGLTAWHSVANLEDIEDVKDLIKALSGSSSESVASVLGRVITLEGYFSNGKAKDADLLDGHNSDYFATATTVNDLLEDYEAFKAVFADNSDDYINTWTEVKNFLDGIKNTEDLNAILLGINTELGKKADKATTLAGYGITDGVLFSERIMGETSHRSLGYGYGENGWRSTGPAIVFGVNAKYRHLIQGTANADASLWHKAYTENLGGGASGWYKILDDNNYAPVLNNDYLRLDGSSVMAKDALLRFQVGDGLYDWNARRGQGFGIIDYNTKAETPQYRMGFHIGGSHYRLDISHQWGANILAYRTYDQTATEVGPWVSILDANNYSDLITALNNNLNVPSITIGGIKLSVVEGQLQIEGDAFATGQLSSGGIGSEGSGSGASGIVILEDWEKYDDTLAQVLGAGLGVGLRDKIAALESKATNVSVVQTLTSGKEIGAITIDGVATKLFAPDDYLPLSGGTLNGSLGMTSAKIPDGAVGLWGTGSLYLKASDKVSFYNSSTGAFNEILHKGNYASVLDSAYLKLSGGMINTGDIAGLTIYRNNSKYSMVHFCNNEEGILVDVGYLGVVGEGVPVYLNSSGNQFNLLHAGNYASVLNDAYFRVFSGGTYNANTISAGGIYRVDAQYEGGESWPIPPAYGNAIHVKVPLSDTAFQIAAPQFSTQRLFFRSFANSTQATQTWKEFAFTDSNVASATKLQTARSLWGNSFDGTADINGDIHLAADKGIVASNGYAVLIAPSYLLLGYAQSELGQTTYLDGNDIYLRYGKNHVPAMLINSSGNVTIGSSDLASTSKKLYVQGDALIERELFGANTADISVLGWRLFANADAAYLQAGKVTGSQNGNLYFTGLYGATLSSFIVYSDSSEMKGRLLVNDATDDGIYALQVNGAAKITGNVALNMGSGYAWRTEGGSEIHNIVTGTTGNFLLGNGGAKLGYNTYVDGNNVYFRYGTTHNVGAFLSSNGSVGIGTDNPQCKLHVYGASTNSNPLCVESTNTWGESSIAFKSKSGYLWTAGLSVGINNSDHFGFYSDTAKKVISRITPTGMVVDGDIHVTGNIIADGQVSSGGVAEAGTGGATGGSVLDRVPFTIPVNTTSFTCEHNLGTREISVSIYEEGNDFQQVLADVYLDSTNVARIVFGSATDVVHKVVIIG